MAIEFTSIIPKKCEACLSKSSLEAIEKCLEQNQCKQEEKIFNPIYREMMEKLLV